MRARPRVEYHVEQSKQQVLDGFAAALADGGECTGNVGRRDITLHLHPARRKLWSPWLQLRVEDDDDGGCTLVGTMGPQPNLWTAFVFVYSALVAAFIGGTMYGLVQLALEEPPTGLAATAAALVALAGACGLDLLGRRLGQGQMGIIRGYVLHTLPQARDLLAS